MGKPPRYAARAHVERLTSSASDNGHYGNQTGVNLAPEWQEGFDNARLERTLEAVRCSSIFGPTPAPGDREKQFLTPVLLP